MRASSMDLRERVLLDSAAGMKAADVAATSRASGSWVRLLKQRRRETGEVAPRVQRQGRRGMLEPPLHTVADLITAHQDRTRAERKDALATPARVPTVWRTVRARGLTVKQKRSARPNTIGLTSRPRGSRGPRRRRPGTSRPSCFWTNPAAPPLCFGGTAEHRVARASPTTPPAGAGRPARFSPRGGSRGCPHRGSSTAQSLASASALTSTRSWCRPCSQATSSLPTTSGPTRSPASSAPSRSPGPPSSPDLNPIALCFAKRKALVRTARCRRSETLWPFLGTGLEHFSPDECRNYFQHGGYSAATRS